jgi:hypothetical protein
MGTTNEPFAHVYARIAEHVRRQFETTDIDAHDVEAVVKDHARSPLRPEIEEAIIEEAKEYGVLDG